MKVSRLTQHGSPRQSFIGEVGRGYQRFAPASSTGKAPLEVRRPVRNDVDRMNEGVAPLQGASDISGYQRFAPAPSAGKALFEVSHPVRNDALDRIYEGFAPLQRASDISGYQRFAPASSAGKAPLEVSRSDRNDAFDRLFEGSTPLIGYMKASHRCRGLS